MSRVDMIHDETRKYCYDRSIILSSTIFRLLFVKLRIQIIDLSEVESYRLFIPYSCKKMVTQWPDWA